MRKRSKLLSNSKKQQWTRWLIVTLIAVVAYFTFATLVSDDPFANPFGRRQRLVTIPVVAAFCVFVYRTRQDEQDLDIDTPMSAAVPKSPSEPPKSAVPPPSPAASAAVARPAPEAVDEGREFWERARQLPHSMIPTPLADAEYLSLVHRAAELGHAEALLKLADYATRRGANVEAYFWATMAVRRGAAGGNAWLTRIRKVWMQSGCQGEYENAYPEFPPERGSIGRALLRIACGIDVAMARQRLRELAAAGNPDAALVLGR